jgi:hypothetical protein
MSANLYKIHQKTEQKQKPGHQWCPSPRGHSLSRGVDPEDFELAAEVIITLLCFMSMAFSGEMARGPSFEISKAVPISL